ncbi:MAG: pyrroline-5-carboxylate reductase [Lachnospiraceae bacterium]|nr:pyrroline-5-carboxylate reductase [Lachnospiraceae bacterium]
MAYNYEYGFIGTGNMGSALAAAVAGGSPDSRIILSNRTAEKAERLAEAFDCTAGDNITAARESKYVVLGVKPQMLPELSEEIRDAFSENEGGVLVTMAAGISTAKLGGMFGGEVPVIRIMPNTPVSIGAGVVLTCRNSLVSDEDYASFRGDLSLAGAVLDIPEEMIDKASVVSGCGPAYFFMFMEYMADAAVDLGIDRETALELVLNTGAGSAALALSSPETLGRLRKNVCSPGGSTIEGVKAFDEAGLEEAVNGALSAAYRRTLELGKG